MLNKKLRVKILIIEKYLEYNITTGHFTLKSFFEISNKVKKKKKQNKTKQNKTK